MWFWGPLAYCTADIDRAKHPELFEQETTSSALGRISIGLALCTLCAFILVNVTSSLFKPNPFLVEAGILFLVDWADIRWWQLLAAFSAAMTIGIAIWINYAGFRWRYANKSGDQEMIAASKGEFRWIEHTGRVRLWMTIVYWVAIGWHTALYFNSLDCWVLVPRDVEKWSRFLYGDRYPTMRCKLIEALGNESPTGLVVVGNER